MPKVLIDVRMVEGEPHGIARYALELARRLPALAPNDWDFSGLVPQGGLPRSLGPLHPDIPLVETTAKYLSMLEQPAYANVLYKHAPDLFHATSFSLPALWPGPLVATLHDANHLALPENYGPAQTAYYRLVVAPRARRARALITVSDFSRRELAEHLELSPYKLQVIHNGVDARFRHYPGTEVAAFKQRLGLPERFVLVMGNEKRHKNLDVIARITPSLPIQIVLCAGPKARRAAGFPRTTRDLSHVDEDDLPLLYSAAELLVFPSYYEGFGLPALEAMACGCPVIVSRGSSLPEVCGDAAVFVEPDSESEWREAILRLLREPSVRRDLAAKGMERATLFSWDDCAQKTFAVYQRALERRGS